MKVNITTHILFQFAMLTLRPSIVPVYLHSSSLYQMRNYGDKEFEVPKKKFKADLTLNSAADLSLLLNTLHHWTSEECFVEVIDYMYRRLSLVGLSNLCSKFAEVWHLRYLNLLREIRNGKHHAVNLALRNGYAVIAVYMLNSGFELNEDSLACALASQSIECIRFVLQEKQIARLGLPLENRLPTTPFGKRSVRIRPSAVPSYLHTSELYKSLDFQNDDEFDVPVLHFKLDLKIESTADLVLLFDTLDYWGSDKIFPEVLHFIYPSYHWFKRLPSFLYHTYVRRWKYFRTMWTIVETMKPYNHMKVALESGVVEIIVFLREQGRQLDDMSIQYAIRSHNPDCVRYVCDNKEFILPAPARDKLFYPREIHFNAAQPCDIHMIKYCIDDNLTDVMTVEFCMIAAKAGDLEVLQQLHELRCTWDVTCCTEAAAQGHLHCLTYAHEQGAPWDASTCAAAAQNKHMECLTYLIENSCPVDGAVSRAAIANGDLEMLIFAHENLLPWEDDMCMLAAHAGSLPCLKYLHEAGCELTSETCAAAATRQGECLKYAHENGAPWTVSTTIVAARRNFSALQYAHQNGCPINRQVGMAAVKANCPMIMVRYMGENKFPFDAEMCRQAAKQGSDHIVKFLHIYGCPWTVATTRDAAAGGHIDALKYAAERGCPVAPITCSFQQWCDEESPHFMCMKYIFDNHDKTFDSVQAVTRGHFDCFKYAHNNGAPWREEIAVTAARLGKLDYLTYAFEEGGCPFYPYYQRVYDAVVENAHEECMEYLNDLYEEKTREIGRIMRDRRRQHRIKGRMLIRRVVISNWFTSHRSTYNCRLLANRFWTTP